MRHHSRSGRDIMRRIAADIRPDRARVLAAAVLVTVSRLCLAFVPMVSGSLVDRISGGVVSAKVLLPQGVLLAVLVLIGYGMDSVVGMLMLTVSGRSARRLRDRAQRKMNRLPLPFLDNHPAGDIQSRLTSDMMTFSNALQTSVSIVSQIVLFVTVVILMFVTDWRLSLAYLVILSAWNADEHGGCQAHEEDGPGQSLTNREHNYARQREHNQRTKHNADACPRGNL